MRACTSTTELGQLGVGSEADLAVLRVQRASFGFIDTGGGKATGDQKLACELTLRAGRVVWDLNGMTNRPWNEIPPPDFNAPPRRGSQTRQ